MRIIECAIILLFPFAQEVRNVCSLHCSLSRAGIKSPSHQQPAGMQCGVISAGVQSCLAAQSLYYVVHVFVSDIPLLCAPAFLWSLLVKYLYEARGQESLVWDIYQVPIVRGEAQQATMRSRGGVSHGGGGEAGGRRQRRWAAAAASCCVLLALSAAAADAVTATARMRAAKRPPPAAAVAAARPQLLAKHGAVWPPRLTAAQRADIMLPEALKTRALLEASSHGRKLQVRAPRRASFPSPGTRRMRPLLVRSEEPHGHNTSALRGVTSALLTRYTARLKHELLLGVSRALHPCARAARSKASACVRSNGA